MSEQLIQTPGTFGENGNFLLERELGSGGMGGVYMGRDKMLDRPVAVKVMLKEYGADAEFVEKFKKEAQSVARLVHPNIAQVYSYGICDGMPYIAMELAAGGSLYSIMNANPGKTDVARVLKICQQVAQALQCASDQGCVHGDVKPENILLDASGNAKLVDFGLAAMQKDTSEIWGTPYYISPEKVKKEPIDFRADMYSLGGTLYHALTGVAPFEGEDSIAVVKKRFEGLPKKPSEIRPDLTPAVDDLVMKMLALKPEDRYPSFEALIETFRSVLTTGLSASTAAQEKKPVAGGTKKMATVRGRRMTMRRPGMSTIKRTPEPGEGDEGAVKDTDAPAAEEEEDEEEGGNLGLKVAGIVVGAVLLVGGVIGGLVWYQVADKKARAAEEQEQIVSGIEKARSAIHDTVVSAEKFADEFDQFANKAIEACQKPTDELKKILPAEQGDMLKPGPSQELLSAIAATNETKAVEEPASTEVSSKKQVEWKNLDAAHYICGGAAVPVADLKGKAVAFFIWSVQDTNSLELVEKMQKQKESFDDKPFVVIGNHLSKYGSKDEVVKFLKEKKLSYPVYEDVIALNIADPRYDSKVPFIYFVDEHGMLRYLGQDMRRLNIVFDEVIPNIQMSVVSETGGREKKPLADKQSDVKPSSKEGAVSPTVIAMNELWDRAYGCQASAVRIRHAVRQVVKKAHEGDDLRDQTRETMEKLAELSRVLVDQFEQVKVSKDVENVKKGITFIKSKGEKTVEQTVKRLRIEKLEADRKAKAEAAAAAEKARLEKIEAEKKAKVEEESAAIASRFETIVAQGCLRQLDWKSALRQLETTKAEFTTPEGQLAADVQIRKINDMKKVQDIFVKVLEGHVFKGKLKGAKVTAVNEKELNLLKADGKTKMKISWQKFYKDYPGNLNEIMNLFIVNARQPTAKHKLSLRDWADAMTGAALTMQLVCSEVNGAVEKAEILAKETVKAFPDYQKTAQEIFPNIKFEAAEE